jgi:Rod binding domain-containing protein
MRQTVHTGLIDNKMGHLFDSFYDQEIGVRGAQAGGIGLADLMVRAYTQNQGFETKNNVKTLSSPPESLPIQGSRG